MITGHAKLFNPGPVEVDSAVWEALDTGDICHRESETLERISRVRQKLVDICGGNETHDSVLITGSGTCALEAAVATAVPTGGAALIVTNGNYGERLREIAASRSLNFQEVRMGWGRSYDLRKIKLALDRRHFTHLIMVHHETSTGMLNPLAEVAKLAHRHGCELIVDAVSSIGAEAIDVCEMGVDWLVGSSNKCLEGLPGMSFVCFKRTSINQAAGENCGLYLDLRVHYAAQAENHQPAFTPAVQVLSAWECALDILIDEGVGARRERYRRATNRVREHMNALGMKPFSNDGELSCSTSVYYLPEWISYDVFHDRMRRRGHIVYHCPPEMGNVVRIATMGQLTEPDIERMLESMTVILSDPDGGTNA